MASLTASPASVANGMVTGGPPWANPGNAVSDNGSYATVTVDMAETSEVLEATNFDFSTIPNDATINGLAATVRAFKSGDDSSLDAAAFYRATGTTWHTAVADFSGTLTGSEAAYTAGGATDLCGTTFAVSDVKDSGFGARFTVVNGGPTPSSVSVDSVTVTVYYTPVGGTAVANKVVSVAQAINRASTY